VASQKRDPRKDPKAALGEALRQLRVDAGYTQGAAAAKIVGYSEDSIQKAETGNQVPTDVLYEGLLPLYNVTPRERVILDVMRAHARHADPVVPEFAEPWLDAEKAAVVIHTWSLDTLPGLTQTYDYAHAMFIKAGLDEDMAAARATARVKRAAILDGKEPTRLTAIIYEPLLYRRVGTSQIMVAEMEHLGALMDKPNVIIQLVRTSEDYFPGHDGEFAIARGRTISDTLNTVSIEDHTMTTQAVVDRASMLFEVIRSYALNVTDSRALIQEALQRWKSRQ
jgi:transcriptional regulator with XRE-family HTH domain